MKIDPALRFADHDPAVCREKATNQPATALPWRVSSDAKLQLIGIRGGRVGEADTVGDATYIAHAANAYPKLVEALRVLAAQVRYAELATGAHVNAAALLHDLWETS